MLRLLIDGHWIESADGRSIDSVNPANGKVIGSVAAAGAGEVRLAVAAARRAFEGWEAVPGRERAALLRAIADGVEVRRDALAALETRDNGKPLAESFGDVDDTIACFRFYAGLADDLDGGDRAVLAVPDSRFSASVETMAVGVAAQIIPWNYPLLMAAWKVAPALAAGATMVLKPSELTSLTALELGRIAQDAGLPRGVFNILTGYGGEAGMSLVEHRDVDKVAFTGSAATGAKIMAAAAPDIKNVSLELGGKSAILIFDDVDIEVAVEWIMFGVFWNQGQVCSATSRLLVDESIADRLLARLVTEVAAIRIGSGLDPDVTLGPLISAAQRDRVAGFVDRAREQGVELLAGGGVPPHLDAGFFYEPTILFQPPVDAEIWTEEVFGPVLAVRCFRTEEEAVALANCSDYGLAAAVLSRDAARCERVARAFRAGVVWINCSQPTFCEAPWGGLKRSGVGRELGAWGLAQYREVKQITRYCSDTPWGWYIRPR
ncbi:MAG: aldehyde dehydrogenase family protein [Sphingopyxis sp.]|jgi:betaine-aldehyde dehydrogenase|uniref:aldehyde dehydrogenase family protein n=1 Tax=Sphingopyxis sp. TaxID=1908224 RepID=UPI001A3AEF19|nr:aldehyde dehydrogenase family protein [Sphingopyxis sp.]MBL9068851.1 aldehyde dehydrogenase family protein [Sphingopyxis sp.]